jgi:hypothetical protein
VHLIEVTPVPCLICGRGNAENRHGERPRFIDLERDVSWDDPAIICEDCAISIGGMIGMHSIDSIKDMRREVKTLRRQMHTQAAQMDSMRRRAKKIGFEFAEDAA